MSRGGADMKRETAGDEDPDRAERSRPRARWAFQHTRRRSRRVGVADVVGPTVVPQIIVGSPSPTVEPAAIGTAYRSLPFRPDVVIDGWSTDAVTVRGVSQRGHLHRYNGAPGRMISQCTTCPTDV